MHWPRRWRNAIRNKRISFALIISVAAHALVIAVLLHRKFVQQPGARKGVIAVEFIEPVRHDPEPVAPGPGPKKPTFRRPEPQVPQAPAEAGLTGPVGDPGAIARETDAYILAVLKLVNRHKVYPPDAIDRGEEGRVVIGVSVGAKGELLDLRIEEPSPFSRLDKAALETIKNVKSFPALPEGVASPIHLHIPLVYRVESH